MKFQPGQSGNPKGRNKGSLNKYTKLIKLLEPHAEILINKTVELALNGDTRALSLCIERLIPKAKEDPIKIVIPKLGGLTKEQIAKKIINLLSGQELSISELKNFMHLIGEGNHTLNNYHEEMLKLLQ